MGKSGSKTAQGPALEELSAPQLEGLSAEEMEKAIENLKAQILERSVEFKPKKTDITPKGQEIIRQVVRVMAALPEMALLVEGHSDVDGKSKKKLTEKDEQRITVQAEDRAAMCKKVLEAEGLRNQMICVGRGATEKLAKGCVKLTLIPATTDMTSTEPATIVDTEAAVAGTAQAAAPTEPEKTEAPAQAAPETPEAPEASAATPATEPQEKTETIEVEAKTIEVETKAETKVEVETRAKTIEVEAKADSVAPLTTTTDPSTCEADPVELDTAIVEPEKTGVLGVFGCCAATSTILR